MARQNFTLRIIGAALLPASLIGGWIYYPFSTTGPTICLWRGVFGRNCLTCGMTRALCSLSRGHFAEAYFYHPFIYPLIILIVFISFNSLRKLFSKSDDVDRRSKYN